MIGLALSLLTALLLLAAFPPFGVWGLAAVALAPILWASANESSWKVRLRNGWLAGTLYWGGICYWIQFVLEEHGGMGKWGSWGAFLLFAVAKGISMGAFSVVVGAMPAGPLGLVGAATLWVGLERLQGPLGFTWLHLGNAAIEMPLPMRLAPIVGVYGLSFVMALLSVGIANAARRRPRIELYPLLALALLLVLPAPTAPAPAKESVRVVQPNIDTERNWDAPGLAKLEQSMALLSRGGGENLIVWPEAPAPFYPSDPAFAEFVGGIARSSGAHVLLGAVGRTPKNEPLNSAYYFNEDGSIAARYDKVHLVPFGEFVPGLFSFVNRITNEAGDFAAGDHISTFRLGTERIGTFICYESAFPEHVREFVQQGAGLLVNISNDGYFGHSAAREQHLLIARMRAVENRRWLLRATNDGITAMINPAGQVTETLEPYQQVAGTFHYAMESTTTTYTNYGDWFAWSCLAAGAVICIRRQLGNRPPSQ